MLDWLARCQYSITGEERGSLICSVYPIVAGHKIALACPYLGCSLHVPGTLSHQERAIKNKDSYRHVRKQ